MDKPEKTTLYDQAIALLQRINGELEGHKQLSTINVKMVGVVKDLNDVRIGDITNKPDTED